MSQKTGWPVPKCLLIFDICIVSIGSILSLIYFHSLVGIREGTIICAFTLGPVMKPIMNVIQKPLTEFCGLQRKLETAMEEIPAPALDADRLIITVDWDVIKGIVEDLCDYFNTDTLRCEPLTSGLQYHPGRAATIYVGDVCIGTMGELLPQIASNFNIKEKVTVAQLSVESLYAVKGDTKRFTPLPKFPALTRDLALVVDLDTPSSSLEKLIREACSDILESISVFDVYTGDKVEKGKKSIAYSLKLRHADRTLKDDEADEAINKALESLKSIGAVIRS